MLLHSVGFEANKNRGIGKKEVLIKKGEIIN